ncbi:MAG: hypothetical protein FJ290_29885 [Planctomycetes bacterium]|nr:hypothetical protein [Planctomycetota bacterium]
MKPNGHVLSLTQMKRRYYGQWLALRVTKRDAAGQPTAGKVLARSPSRLEVSEAARDEKHVCLLYAGEPVPKGYGVLYQMAFSDSAHWGKDCLKAGLQTSRSPGSESCL